MHLAHNQDETGSSPVPAIFFMICLYCEKKYRFCGHLRMHLVAVHKVPEDSARVIADTFHVHEIREKCRRVS